uniref:Phage protein n=1 Tax=Heterorhabditis bacteriophora TaxID=37862 RepID=A0A1I7W6K9_HETBA
MDLAIRYILENKPNKTVYNNLDSLKVVLVKYWEEISEDELQTY